MKFIKSIFILSAFLLTLVAIDSCKTSVSKKGSNQGTPQSFRQVFWDSLPQPDGYVNDFENLFTEMEEQTIDSLIRDFEYKTSIQIALITLDTTMVTKANFDELILRIANFWGVGQKNNNNGLVIGISRGYRKMRIQNGYGIARILTDEETKKIIDTAFIPCFRDAKYFEGTHKGLVTLMKTLEGLSK